MRYIHNHSLYSFIIHHSSLSFLIFILPWVIISPRYFGAQDEAAIHHLQFLQHLRLPHVRQSLIEEDDETVE